MVLDSINGKGRGKSGSKVYFVSHGVQLERAYTSSIHNPNTAAQVSQRSRFKLQSQVSAALEKVLVIPRQRLMSPRNRFVKINNGYFYSNENGAQVSYENLQITAGTLALPGISVDRTPNPNMELSLLDSVASNFDRVVYCIFRKTAEQQLYYVKSVVAEIDSNNDNAHISTYGVNGSIVVYAYGMRDRDAKAKAAYNNYQITSATDIATLIASRKLLSESYIFSQTRGVSVEGNNNTNITPGTGEALMYVTLIGNGTLKYRVGEGQEITLGQSPISLPLGSQIALAAIPTYPDNAIIQWCNNGEQTPFSYANTIQFTLNSLRDIVCEIGERVHGLE